MRTLLLLSVLAAASPLVAEEQTAPSKKETKQVNAEVVSMDKTAKTLTIKTESRESMTGTKTFVVKVEDKILASLDTVKPGQKVTLTCHGTKDRDCDTVSLIQKASAIDYD